MVNILLLWQIVSFVKSFEKYEALTGTYYKKQVWERELCKYNLIDGETILSIDTVNHKSHYNILDFYSKYDPIYVYIPITETKIRKKR